ncbi:MAG: site-2 protease family protein [Verrucomicrobiota bacterium]|jgi:Zn-dependent protease
MPTRRGSFHLFRLFGIDVYLHWAWFLAVWYFVNEAKGYSSPVWSVLECLSLFLIVLIHEFGHQLACRQVGGKTSQIILWPLGGVAYVSPPQRPGAQLWSIAAGPLVNVILFPILGVLALLSGYLGWEGTLPDLNQFLTNICIINLVLLIFNMLPIYPLDGGQILRSLLWFLFGRANSLLAASVIGFIGVVALIGLAVLEQNILLGAICVFILLNCWGGLIQARALARIAKMPRRDGFACPACKIAPPVGAIWRCGKCGKPFDTFATQAICPNCGTQFSATQCLDCGSSSQIGEWMISPPPPPIINV